MTGVKMTPEFARAVQKMVREYLQKSQDVRPTRQSAKSNPHDYSFRLGKTDAAVTAPASVTVSIYSGTTKGSETDTGDNVTAFLRYSELAINQWCHVAFIDGGWEILVGDPCAE